MSIRSARLGLVIEIEGEKLFNIMLARWSGTLYYIYAESIISYKDFVAVGNTMHL